MIPPPDKDEHGKDRLLYHGAGIAALLTIGLLLLGLVASGTVIATAMTIALAPFIIVVGIAITVNWREGTRGIVRIMRAHEPRIAMDNLPYIGWILVVGPMLVFFGLILLIPAIKEAVK